jgi:hypothetical protein
MLTRQMVVPQYQHAPGGAPPPHHVAVHPHQRAPGMDRARLYGAGGLMGGAVNLTARGLVGQSRGNTGYGYLGMDPSDPMTWPRPFMPTAGMISYLNFGAVS